MSSSVLLLNNSSYNVQTVLTCLDQPESLDKFERGEIKYTSTGSNNDQPIICDSLRKTPQFLFQIWNKSSTGKVPPDSWFLFDLSDLKLSKSVIGKWTAELKLENNRYIMIVTDGQYKKWPFILIGGVFLIIVIIFVIILVKG